MQISPQYLELWYICVSKYISHIPQGWMDAWVEMIKIPYHIGVSLSCRLYPNWTLWGFFCHQKNMFECLLNVSSKRDHGKQQSIRREKESGRDLSYNKDDGETKKTRNQVMSKLFLKVFQTRRGVQMATIDGSSERTKRNWTKGHWKLNFNGMK